MLSSGTPGAYLVMTMVRAGGDLVLESETICFDREFAIAIAREDCGDGPDCRECAWSGVYCLDADGRCIGGAPIFWAGSLTAAPGQVTCLGRCTPPHAESPLIRLLPRA